MDHPCLKVVNTNELVAMILKHLDKKDLLNCRMLSPKWNDLVLQLLASKQNPFDGETLAHVTYKGSRKCDLYKMAKATEEKRTLNYFYNLLQESKNPEWLIKWVEISSTIIWPCAYPINILECQLILRYFGQHVEKLVIKDDKYFTISSQCLGQRGYCPNVQDLELKITEAASEYLPCFRQPNVRNLGDLKLKKLTLNYTLDSVTNVSINGVLMVFNGILDNSPEIEYLKIDAENELDSSDYKTNSFLQALRSNIEATKNLKELHVSGNVVNNLQNLCLIQFGSNLKTIYLKENSFREIENVEQQLMLGKFLKIISQNLETLDISLWVGSPGGNETVSQSTPFIPLLPKLVKLNYSSYYSGPYEPSIPQFLKNAPSLRSMWFGDYYSEQLVQVLENCWNITPGALNNVPRLIHKDLECFEAGGWEIFNPEIIHNLNVAFPNLSELHLQPQIGPERTMEEHQSWFESCFLYISQMKHLKDLKVDVSDWECGELIVDLKRTFSKLKNAPNLVKLTFSEVVEGFHIYKVNALVNSLGAVVGAPKLRRIIFTKLFLRNKDLNMKFTGLKAELEANNIVVEGEPRTF